MGVRGECAGANGSLEIVGDYEWERESAYHVKWMVLEHVYDGMYKNMGCVRAKAKFQNFRFLKVGG